MSAAALNTPLPPRRPDFSAPGRTGERLCHLPEQFPDRAAKPRFAGGLLPRTVSPTVRVPSVSPGLSLFLFPAGFVLTLGRPAGGRDYVEDLPGFVDRLSAVARILHQAAHIAVGLLRLIAHNAGLVHTGVLLGPDVDHFRLECHCRVAFELERGRASVNPVKNDNLHKPVRDTPEMIGIEPKHHSV